MTLPRAVVGAAVAVAALLAGATTSSPALASSRLEVVAGPIHYSIASVTRERWTQAGPSALRWQVEAWMRRRRVARQGRVSASIRWPRSALATISDAVESPRVTRVRVAVGVTRVEIRQPRVRQAWRNNCETAALSMLLGGEPDQERLQSLLPIAAPLAPLSTSRGLVWGDPEQGFVGDVRSGGYGVYERPILRLARTVGANPVDLTGDPFVRLMDSVRDGRPVLVWLTLGRSSSRSWRTPRGRLVHADAAEHAVVVVGWEPGLVVYLDPWDGARKVEDLESFAARWRVIGKRAITVSRAP